MKSRNVAEIALKMLSVYLVLSFLEFLPSGFMLIQADSQIRRTQGENPSLAHSLMSPGVFAVEIMSVAFLTFALILFVKARNIGRFFVADPEEAVSLNGPISSDVLAMAFRCLGVYALVTWVPVLAQSLAKAIVTASQYPDPVPWLYTFSWITIIPPVIGSLIGLLLVLRTNVVIRLAKLSRADSPRSLEAKESPM